MKEITEEMVKDAVEGGWSEEDARRGYSIFTSDFGNGAEHIERIDEMDVFESDGEAAKQAEKDGIKIIRDLEFKDTEDFAYYIDTPENRELLKDLVDNKRLNMAEKYVLIELNLFAEGEYSGATYEEIVFITPQDYIKYFGSGQDTEASTFKDYIENMWEDTEISVGELDGKHSEVFGDVEVDFWDSDRIAEYWEQPDNDGHRLIGTMAHKVFGDNVQYTEVINFKNKIEQHVKEVVDSIGTKVTVSCKVPKDKAKELEAFVEKLNAE